ITDMVLRDFGDCDSGVYLASNAEGVTLDGLTIVNTGMRAVTIAGSGSASLRVSAARLVAPAGGGDFGIDAGYIDDPTRFSISDDCHSEGYETPVRVHAGNFDSARAAARSMWPSDTSITSMADLTEAG